MVRHAPHEYLFLIAGHSGELAFAAIFFWRAMYGGFYQEYERPFYSMLAWHFWTANVFLCWNLVYSATTRHWYLHNGSFGLQNDYVRLASMLNWYLESVALLMLLVSLLLPPLGIGLWWWSLHGKRT